MPLAGREGCPLPYPPRGGGGTTFHCAANTLIFSGFEAKNVKASGAPPQAPMGELTALPHTPLLVSGWAPPPAAPPTNRPPYSPIPRSATELDPICLYIVTSLPGSTCALLEKKELLQLCLLIVRGAESVGVVCPPIFWMKRWGGGGGAFVRTPPPPPPRVLTLLCCQVLNQPQYSWRIKKIVGKSKPSLSRSGWWDVGLVVQKACYSEVW